MTFAKYCGDIDKQKVGMIFCHVEHSVVRNSKTMPGISFCLKNSKHVDDKRD